MDGVMADFVPTWIKFYNHITNEAVKLEDIKSHKVSKYVKDQYTLRRIKDSPGFIRGLPPCEGSVEAIFRLHKAGHKICFVSNGTNCPSSGHEKREWLYYYFHKLWDKAPLMLGHDKTWARVDVMIDDDPKNLQDQPPGVHRILWDTTYNRSVNDKTFVRISSWTDLEDWIKTNDPTG